MAPAQNKSGCNLSVQNTSLCIAACSEMEHTYSDVIIVLPSLPSALAVDGIDCGAPGDVAVKASCRFTVTRSLQIVNTGNNIITDSWIFILSK